MGEKDKRGGTQEEGKGITLPKTRWHFPIARDEGPTLCSVSGWYYSPESDDDAYSNVLSLEIPSMLLMLPAHSNIFNFFHPHHCNVIGYVSIQLTSDYALSAVDEMNKLFNYGTEEWETNPCNLTCEQE